MEELAEDKNDSAAEGGRRRLLNNIVDVATNPGEGTTVQVLGDTVATSDDDGDSTFVDVLGGFVQVTDTPDGTRVTVG